MSPTDTPPVMLRRSIPVGLESILAMAAAHEPFAAELLKHRATVAEACGYELSQHASKLLATVPEPQLLEMLAAIRKRQLQSERRKFLVQATAAVGVILAGTSAPGCRKSRDAGPGRVVREIEEGQQEEHRTSMGCRAMRAYSHRRVSVSVENVRIKGPLTRDAVRKTVASAISDLQPCFSGTNLLLEKGDHSVVLAFTSGKRGKVDKLSQTKSELYIPAVEAQIARVIRRLVFPSAKAESRVSMRLRFGLLDRDTDGRRTHP